MCWRSAIPKQLHNAHDFEILTVYYRWHPLFGQSVRVHRRHRFRAADCVHVRLADQTICALPPWMFNPICLEFVIGPPLISVDALTELGALLGTLHSDVAECDNTSLKRSRKEGTDEGSRRPARTTEPQAGGSAAGGSTGREKRRIELGMVDLLLDALTVEAATGQAGEGSDDER